MNLLFYHAAYLIQETLADFNNQLSEEIKDLCSSVCSVSQEVKDLHNSVPQAQEVHSSVSEEVKDLRSAVSQEVKDLRNLVSEKVKELRSSIDQLLAIVKSMNERQEGGGGVEAGGGIEEQ